jgi:2-polyprenyl-3-methyl-5-hydroxy-6-metoxy-1,4-benzoquinol methylase
MTKNADAYGAELWDYYTTKKDNREIVERDDNFIDGDRKGYGGSVYFAKYKDWSPIEKKAIAYARGRVLDVGCGAGKHALYLQKKGLDVTGRCFSTRCKDLQASWSSKGASSFLRANRQIPSQLVRHCNDDGEQLWAIRQFSKSQDTPS